MNFQAPNDWRNKMNTMPAFGAMHYSIASYCTDAETKTKADMRRTFGEEVLLNNFQMLSNPLQKNLADTLPYDTQKGKPNNTMDDTAQNFEQRRDMYNSFAGITNFISGVFNMLSGGVFHRRSKSPVSQCCPESAREGSPAQDAWHAASDHENNKTSSQSTRDSAAMSVECRAAAAHCEDKLKKVRLMLSSKAAPGPPKTRARRARKAFVEAGSVEEHFEDAFSPEDFVSLPNETYFECINPPNNQSSELVEVDAPMVKTEWLPVCENMDIVKTLPEEDTSKASETSTPQESKEMLNTSLESASDTVHVLSTCEDKVNRLKALLSARRKTSRADNSPVSAPEPAERNERPQPTKTIPVPRVQDKRFKNRHRLSGDRRKKSQLMRNVQEDMFFANEIDSEELSSLDQSPSIDRMSDRQSESSADDVQFDEVAGRFCANSTDSEDSFQIVFNDCPRQRLSSDCDSEDSFIVFEDSPDGCYTSNDVFGQESGSDEESDSDLDVCATGCRVLETCKLSHALSRTVGDLTDDSLYEDDRGDEVDCAVRSPPEDRPEQVQSTGLLMNEAKKLQRQQCPAKKVHFSDKPPKVHVMRVWAFAARQARAGHWERHALDRERFKRRIANVDMAVSWVLRPQHRSRVMFQRFMPWWNAQKRKELEEKKQKEEDERLQREAAEKDTESDSSPVSLKDTNNTMDNAVETFNNSDRVTGTEITQNVNTQTTHNKVVNTQTVPILLDAVTDITKSKNTPLETKNTQKVSVDTNHKNTGVMSTETDKSRQVTIEIRDAQTCKLRKNTQKFVNKLSKINSTQIHKTKADNTQIIAVNDKLADLKIDFDIHKTLA